MNFFTQSTDPDISDANVKLQLQEDQLQEDQLQDDQAKPTQEQVTPANQLDEVAQTVNIPQ
jgi:hypothetical protein